MRIACVSDTHTFGAKISVPDADMLIHAGDHTFRGTYGEMDAALKWMDSQPHKYKLLVAGNHDFYPDERFENGYEFRNWEIERPILFSTMLARYPGLTYLQDSGVEIEGLKFYGSPWQPWFHEWAFNFPLKRGLRYGEAGRNDIDPDLHDREAARTCWAKIPDDTQVLITHGPPLGILDAAVGHSGDNRTGCPELMKRIEQLKDLRLHVFGHIHEQYGRVDYDQMIPEEPNKTRLTFVNASINTRNYEPINAPIVVEIEAP